MEERSGGGGAGEAEVLHEGAAVAADRRGAELGDSAGR